MGKNLSILLVSPDVWPSFPLRFPIWLGGFPLCAGLGLHPLNPFLLCPKDRPTGSHPNLQRGTNRFEKFRGLTGRLLRRALVIVCLFGKPKGSHLLHWDNTTYKRCPSVGKLCGSRMNKTASHE